MKQFPGGRGCSNGAAAALSGHGTAIAGRSATDAIADARVAVRFLVLFTAASGCPRSFIGTRSGPGDDHNVFCCLRNPGCPRTSVHFVRVENPLASPASPGSPVLESASSFGQRFVAAASGNCPTRLAPSTLHGL